MTSKFVGPAFQPDPSFVRLESLTYELIPGCLLAPVENRTYFVAMAHNRHGFSVMT
jgi:hypothetical protein